jgi:SAM-dependent methyltransferase
MNTPNEFYRKHYGGAVQIGSVELQRYENEMFLDGKRYHMAIQYFSEKEISNGTLVEIGCGGGEALILLQKRYRFSKIVGVDVALNGAHNGIEFRKDDLDRRWSFDDHEVDFLLAMMVLEHLYDPFHSFAEIKRVLAPQGSAFVNLPLVTAWRNRLRLLFGGLPITSSPYSSWANKREWDGNHLHYFSLQSIKDLAKAVGLEVAEVRGVGPMHQLKSMIPTVLASEVTFRLIHSK